MKYRKCHVTNSSSSSYVCEICGRSESGFDLCLSEAGMYECVNGHVFCCDEALEPTDEELKNTIIDCYYNENRELITKEEAESMSHDELMEVIACDGNYDIPECMCPICQFIEYSEYDLSKYLLKMYKVPREEVFAEVKKYNKRRKKLYENEYITYVCKQYNLNPTEIVASWKEEFGTYSKFREWLN